MITSSITRLGARAAACAILAIGLTGCSFQFHLGSPKAMPGNQVAALISSRVAEQVGRGPEKVTCPDLPAEVGQKVTCQLTAQGRTYDVAVTATGVEDDVVKFDFTVRTTPLGAPPVPAALPTIEPAQEPDVPPTPRPAVVTVRGPEVAAQAGAKWREQNGAAPSSVTCPSLRGVPGAKITCRLTDQGQDYDVTVVVTRVTGTKVDFTLTSRPR
jgi:Domain of unknown function (DUF4333)